MNVPKIRYYERLPKELYYLSVAEAVSARSTCINKHYGAIIVSKDCIVSTGYNGSPRGLPNCSDIGKCFRLEHHIPRGTQYETCKSIHAEANCIISATYEEMHNSTMYIYGYDCVNQKLVENPDCCMMCKRLIINAGIKEVIFADEKGVHPWSQAKYGYRVVPVRHWIDNYDPDKCDY